MAHWTLRARPNGNAMVARTPRVRRIHTVYDTREAHAIQYKTTLGTPLCEQSRLRMYTSTS